MGTLYLVTTDENHSALVNISPDNANEMAAKGWRVLRLGMAHPDVMPGGLANVIDITQQFSCNLDKITVVPVMGK